MLFCPQLLSFLRIFFLSQRVRNRDWHGLSDWPAKQWDPWETLIVLAFYGTQDNLLARTDGITKTYLWIIVFSSSKKKRKQEKTLESLSLIFCCWKTKMCLFYAREAKKSGNAFQRWIHSFLETFFPRKIESEDKIHREGYGRINVFLLTRNSSSVMLTGKSAVVVLLFDNIVQPLFRKLF